MMTTPSHAHRGVHWAPETRWGTWALSLAGLALGGTVALAIAFSHSSILGSIFCISSDTTPLIAAPASGGTFTVQVPV